MERSLVLLTNDDGIEAEGIRALEEAFGDDLAEVWTIAPASERSTSSHALTLRQPVAVKAVAERRFAVDGWPADCVYLALFALLPRRPALVISGINAGPNLGTDVLYSGTVGAAREAFTRGISAISLSLVDGGDYRLAARFARALALPLLGQGERSPELPPTFLNVNVPGAEARGAALARLGERVYPEQGVLVGERDGWQLYRIGGGLLRDALLPGTDGEAIGRGLISVTPLTLDCTAPGRFTDTAPLVEGAWSGIAAAS